jgi:hypothetical protein
MLSQRREIAFLACALALGCSDHKNPKSDLACGETGCLKGPPIGGGGESGSDAGLGDGSIGDATFDAAEGVTATGSVTQFQADDFASTIPFGDPATIRFEGASGVPVEGSYNGSTFNVSGALPSAATWATVIPATTNTALPTIEPVNTASKLPLELHVIPPSTIDLIYNFLSIPEARDPGHAHVVLHFVDKTTLDPVIGVTVTHAGEAVAYDSAGNWSDVEPGTGEAGYAVVVNVATTTVPAKQIFKYSSAVASGGVEILVAADSVTIAQVVLGQ